MNDNSGWSVLPRWVIVLVLQLCERASSFYYRPEWTVTASPQQSQATDNKGKRHQKNANVTAQTIVSVLMTIAVTLWIIMLLSSMAKHVLKSIQLSFRSGGIILSKLMSRVCVFVCVYFLLTEDTDSRPYHCAHFHRQSFSITQFVKKVAFPRIYLFISFF